MTGRARRWWHWSPAVLSAGFALLAIANLALGSWWALAWAIIAVLWLAPGIADRRRKRRTPRVR